VTLSAIIRISVDLCRTGFPKGARVLKLDGTGSLREAGPTNHLKEMIILPSLVKCWYNMEIIGAPHSFPLQNRWTRSLVGSRPGRSRALHIGYKRLV